MPRGAHESVGPACVSRQHGMPTLPVGAWGCQAALDHVGGGAAGWMLAGCHRARARARRDHPAAVYHTRPGRARSGPDGLSAV